MCLEAPLVFVSFLSKVAGKVAVWIGNWVTNKEECCCWFVDWSDEER